MINRIVDILSEFKDTVEFFVGLLIVMIVIFIKEN